MEGEIEVHPGRRRPGITRMNLAKRLEEFGLMDACAKTTLKCVALWEGMVDNPACPWILRLAASDRLMNRAFGMPLRPVVLQGDVASTELRKVVHEVKWLPQDPADKSVVTVPEPD
jgi:hypothetical protein